MIIYLKIDIDIPYDIILCVFSNIYWFYSIKILAFEFVNCQYKF